MKTEMLTTDNEELGEMRYLLGASIQIERLPAGSDVEGSAFYRPVGGRRGSWYQEILAFI